MASVADAGKGAQLYASAPKIYPRQQGGRFARLRWGMVCITQAIFYGLPWLQWHGRQAVLFDIAARRFHLFGVTLWPQDFILLTGLLVCCALALFLFTAVSGRLWCGYACPQTVYTSLFLWLERLAEGDWSARRRLDGAPLGTRKLLRKVAKHASWGLLAGWTGLSFVGYFTPIRLLVPALSSLQLGPWESFWILFYGFATYGNAGWMREQVCIYMCPYARFQGVMMDADTITVSYDRARGEPRGGRARGQDAGAAGLGACLDCQRCRQVCPTGIDIRDGLQIECINCGLCVDACNGIMRRIDQPHGLIAYASENQWARLNRQRAAGLVTSALPGVFAPDGALSHLLRRRTVLYSSLLLVALGLLGSQLLFRTPVRLDVMRDRAVLARDTPDGRVENVYRLQVLNMVDRPRAFRVQVSGIAGAVIAGSTREIRVPALGSSMVAVDVDVDPDQLHAPRTAIRLAVVASDDPAVSGSSTTQFFSH